MQLDPQALRGVFDVITFIGVVGGAWAGLLIKNALFEMKNDQANVRADLVQSQTEIKEQLTERHTEVVRELSMHMVRDEEQFKVINHSLSRIETKLDRNGKGS